MLTSAVAGIYHQVKQGSFCASTALMQDILAIKFDINLVKTRNKYFTERKARGVRSKLNNSILFSKYFQIPMHIYIYDLIDSI